MAQCSALEARAARAVYELHVAAAVLDAAPGRTAQLVSRRELRDLAERADAAGTAVADAGIEADPSGWGSSNARALVAALEHLALTARRSSTRPSSTTIGEVRDARDETTRLVTRFEDGSPCNERGFPRPATSNDAGARS